MDRRVCSSVARRENLIRNGSIDWTTLPDELIIQIFSSLNNRDRASLSLTCRSLRSLGNSPDLWKSLDLRMYNCDARIADLLSSRCSNLTKLQFRGGDVARALASLNASNLREISGDLCMFMGSASLLSILFHHKELESLQLGPEPCLRIRGVDIHTIAALCVRLRKLSLSGISEVDGIAFKALARRCHNLTDISFLDCLNVDLKSLGNVVSVRFISVAGTSIVESHLVLEHWSKLPNLECLDVSQTDLNADDVLKLLSSSQSLKVMCALDCPSFQDDARLVAYKRNKDKLLITLSTDIFTAVASLFGDTIVNERSVFSKWRCSSYDDRKLNEIMTWLEWTLSHSLMRIAESNSPGFPSYWLDQGVALLVSLAKSLQEDVQERAVTALGTFATKVETDSIYSVRCAAVIRDGGIQQLLQLSKSWREVLQSVSIKAIANLSVNPEVVKAIAENGGISIVVNLARSMYISVAQDATKVLWNLSARQHKDAIAKVGGLQALIDLIFKWPIGGDAVLERAVGALANLVIDEKCNMLAAELGGLNALIRVFRRCNYEGVLEQVARALANIAAHDNITNAALGQEIGALEVLMQLTRSPHDGVREAAADGLMRLCFYHGKGEAVAAAGGIKVLVDLANSTSDASHSLQEKVAIALWGLSVSETNSIAIGREGGIASLAALVRPGVEDFERPIAGALQNLAYYPSNVLRILEDGGIVALFNLCCLSISKLVRFMSALALSYMFDERMNQFILAMASSERDLTRRNIDSYRILAMGYINNFINMFYNPIAFCAAAASSSPASLTKLAELARIPEACHRSCSRGRIERLVLMLRNPSDELNFFAAYALMQLTLPGGQFEVHNSSLLVNSGATRVIRATAAAATAPSRAKICAKIVLRNIEHHQNKTSLL